MSTSYVKFCPKCRTATALETPVCSRCGHRFRTQFPEPISERTIAMTAVPPGAVPSDADGVSPAPPLRVHPPAVKRRIGSRERFQLLVIALSALAVLATILIAWDQAVTSASRRHHHVSAPGPARIVGAASQIAVIVGSGPERPVPLATRSTGDLATWIRKSGSEGSKGEVLGDTDDPTCIDLYLAGRIVLIPSGTHAQVLKDTGLWRRILVLDGSHKGATGFTTKASVRLPAELGPGTQT